MEMDKAGWIMAVDLIMNMDYGLCVYIGHGYQTLDGYKMTLLMQE